MGKRKTLAISIALAFAPWQLAGAQQAPTTGTPPQQTERSVQTPGAEEKPAAKDAAPLIAASEIGNADQTAQQTPGTGTAPATGSPAATGTATPASGDVTDLGTTVVTGLRGSTGKSLDIKKNAGIVLDSINATELGRFPDDNVADSLSHITGISISRTTGGEGLYVGVRGLGSQYNIVTLNGRILATDDDGRDLAFDVLPADVISGADVLKSAQASDVEGSIGGTVNLRSARPFDDPGFHGAIRAEDSYNDMSYFGGRKYSAFVSDTNDDRTLGLLIGVVSSDIKTRTDALNYNTYDPQNPGVWPLTGPNSQPVVGECCISFGSVIDEKRRDALSTAFQWKPNSDLKVTVDGLYTHLDDPQRAYNEAYYPDFAYDQFGNPEWSHVVVKNGVITSFQANNFVHEIVNNTIDRVVTTSLIGTNAVWQASPDLKITGDIYRSRADRPEGGQDTFIAAGVGYSAATQGSIINWTNTNGGLPNIGVTLPNGMNYGTALANGYLNNNNYWDPHYVGLSGYSVKDEVTDGLLSGSYSVGVGNFDTIEFGITRTNRTKSRADDSNDWTNGSNQYSNLYVTPVGQSPISFGSLGSNVVSIISLPNFMQGSGGSFPMNLAQFNVQAYLNALKKLNGLPNLQQGALASVYDFALTLPQFNPTNSYSVTEDTSDIYAEGTFSGDHWSGNVGVRLTHTDTTASTAVNRILSVYDPTPNIPTSAPQVTYSLAQPVTADGSYTVPLPAANYLYEFSDELQLRLGLAQAIARPNLNQLAPTYTDGTINRVYELYYSGNADLKPIRSTQFDTSIEYYYEPKSAITAAIFAKRLTDFITTETTNNVNIGVPGYLYSIQQPINGDRALVSGLELAWQHWWDNGFGVRTQYTRSWSKAWVLGDYVGQLEGVSPNTASIGLMYEKGPWAGALSCDYAGRFVENSTTEVPGWANIADSFVWLTATASYEVSRDLKIYIEGKNLSNSIFKSFANGRQDTIYSNGNTGTSSSVGDGYSAYGRTFVIGLSLKL